MNTRWKDYVCCVCEQHAYNHWAFSKKDMLYFCSTDCLELYKLNPMAYIENTTSYFKTDCTNDSHNIDLW